MRVTSIKKNGKRLTRNELELIQLELKMKFESAGFLTGCEIREVKRNPKSVDPTDVRHIVKAIRASQLPPKPVRPAALFLHIGMHMSSFRIDTKRLGHNARISPYCKTVSGYKRTNVPTWNQRVEFNDLINDVLDSFGVTASIRSGCFVVRTQSERKGEYDWNLDAQTATGFHATADRGIMPESEARDECDSENREKQAKLERNRVAREKRAALKASQS